MAITVTVFATRRADCCMKSASEIISMSVRVTVSKKCIQMQKSLKSCVLSDSFQCKQEMAFF